MISFVRWGVIVALLAAGWPLFLWFNQKFTLHQISGTLDQKVSAMSNSVAGGRMKVETLERKIAELEERLEKVERRRT